MLGVTVRGVSARAWHAVRETTKEMITDEKRRDAKRDMTGIDGFLSCAPALATRVPLLFALSRRLCSLAYA
jgi:hypothetical protein